MEEEEILKPIKIFKERTYFHKLLTSFFQSLICYIVTLNSNSCVIISKFSCTKNTESNKNV